MPQQRKSESNLRSQQKLGRQLRCESLEPRLALTVVINEFLADNVTGIQDAAGHRHDWIELKNTGATVEDISGWYLTDSTANLTKWQIPASAETTSLAPGESILVFASGNNGEVGLVGSEFHSNFQLSQEPGYLGLVEANGVTIADQFNFYPQQTSDVSYGRGVGVGSTTTETFLSAGSSSTGDGSLAYFRPYTGINANVDDHWTDIAYVESAADGWVTTTNGLGYGYSSPWQDSTVSLAGELAGYVRMPFTVTDAAQLTSLNLDLRVDNGYLVYLNGRQVQRERIPTTFKIGNDWTDSKQLGGLNARQNLSNSTITGSPAEIDLTAWLDVIEEGENVLAIYAANHTSDQGDFLVHAELTGERANGSVADTYMVSPTPNAENGAGYAGVLLDTVFSHDRGFYDAPFNLTISAVGPAGVVQPGATIRYTTDGSIPTLTNGSTYSGPLTIDPATMSHADAGLVTLRVAAFQAGYAATNVDTQTYIFLDDVLTQDGSGLPTFSNWGNSGPDWEVNPSIVSSVGAANLKDDLKSIPTISLVTDWEEFFGNGSTGDGHGIYTQTTDWREKSDERQASVEFFTADLSEEFQVDASVEIQGHSSTIRSNGNWRSDKLSLEVKFKQPYDTKLESDTLFGNAVNAGDNVANDFDSLILDAQYNYTFHVNNTSTQGPYATYIHDQVVADLQNLAGGQAPHGRWVHLYINGMYWGIYNAHERPSDGFAEEYNGGSKSDYLVVKGYEGRNLLHGGTQGKYQQSDGGIASQIAYQAMLDEVDDNLASLAEYQDVEALLDVDDFIDYMIVTYYAGNYDWGEWNWFASYNSVDPEGRWRFHSWDQEHAFPNDQNAPAGDGRNQDYDHTDLVTNDFGEHEYGPTGIHHMLMDSPEYRLRFSDRVEELMRNDGLLTPANAQAVWQARIDEISEAINGEAARWGDNRNPAKTAATWLTNVEYTRDNFFTANGSYQSRTDITIDIFNNTIASGVGKTDWLVNLDAPNFSQYGGEFTAPLSLTLSNPNGTGTLYYTLDGSDPRAAGGGVSPAAIAYTGGAISLTEATRVRARVFDSGQAGTADDWSAEVDKQFILDEPLSLRVVELMYNPSGGAPLEYMELLNIGDDPIDLAGVQITDFSTTPYTFAPQTLAAGERIVVAEDVSAFQAAYPSVSNVVGTSYSGSLSNGGETVSLRDTFGNLIQSFTYDDLAPWAVDADGAGKSLEYIGPYDADAADPSLVAGDPYDDPANWQASAAIGGTPGASSAAGPVGDYDGDGSVDSDDLALWKSTYGSTTDLRADGNNNNRIDAGDYAVWREALAFAMAPPAPVAATLTTPPVAQTVAVTPSAPLETEAIEPSSAAISPVELQAYVVDVSSDASFAGYPTSPALVGDPVDPVQQQALLLLLDQADLAVGESEDFEISIDKVDLDEHLAGTLVLRNDVDAAFGEWHSGGELG